MKMKASGQLGTEQHGDGVYPPGMGNMIGHKWGRLLSLTTNLLLASRSTVCAFGPRHIHDHPLVARRATSLQKSNLAAFSDPSSSPSSSPSSISTPGPGPPFRLKHIDHVVIRCRNFPAMFDFYHRVLGCAIDEPIDEHLNRFGGALTHLRAGSCYIDLLAYDTNHLTEEGQEATASMHAGGVGLDNKRLDDLTLSSETSTLDHLCLRIDPFDKEQLLNYLEEENVDIIVIGDKRLGADGVGPSVYVRDPEGNVIELKGSPYQDENTQNNNDINTKNNQVDTKSHVPDDTLQKSDGENIALSSSNDTQEDSPTTSSITENCNLPDVPVTPCNRICRYNSSFYDGQVCIGCFRETYEIEMWQSMTPMQKSMTLLDTIDRCSDNNQGDYAMGEKFDGAITIDELTRQYAHWSDLAKK